MLTIAAFNQVNAVLLSYWLRAKVRRFPVSFQVYIQSPFPPHLRRLTKSNDRVAGYAILRPCVRREAVDALFVLIRASSKTFSLVSTVCTPTHWTKSRDSRNYVIIIIIIIIRRNWKVWKVPRPGKRDSKDLEIKDKSGASGCRCIGFSVKEAGRLLGATRN